MSKLTKLESEGELLYNEKKEELHRNYHFALLASCESWWELKIISNLTNHIERYRRVLAITLNTSSSEYHEVQNEHHLLMSAVISKNFKEASSILDEHRKRTYKLIREKLETI
jgi:DNA-binding GntR family transcriptional regulator